MLEEAKEENRQPQAVFASLNLSSDQKEKIQEIMESQKEEISNILTDEQKDLLRQRMQQMPLQ